MKPLIYTIHRADDWGRGGTCFITTSIQKICEQVESTFEDLINKGFDVYVEVWEDTSEKSLEYIYVGGPYVTDRMISEEYYAFKEKHLKALVSQEQEDFK